MTSTKASDDALRARMRALTNTIEEIVRERTKPIELIVKDTEHGVVLGIDLAGPSSPDESCAVLIAKNADGSLNVMDIIRIIPGRST